MLLDVEVAGEPGVIEPIAYLIFHVAPAFAASVMPERAGIVSALNGDDIADGAVQHAAESLAHAAVVTPAQARYQVEPVSPRVLAGVPNGPYARSIDRHRLFDE